MVVGPVQMPARLSGTLHDPSISLDYLVKSTVASDAFWDDSLHIFTYLLTYILLVNVQRALGPEEA